ncbi:unnamed protein product, partial [Allacma fusca]
MSANTILLDFSVDTTNLTEEGIQSIESDVVKTLESQLKSESLQNLTKSEIPSGGHMAVFLGPRGSVITIRVYPNGLVTVNIDYYLEEGKIPLLTLE